MAPLPGSIARCTFPTTRSTMRSSISPPAIWASRPSTPRCRQDWHAHLLGPVVSRGSPHHRDAGSERDFLSHRDRLASGGERGVRRCAVRCLADHPARPRHRQRHLRRLRQPGSAKNMETFAATASKAPALSSGAAPSSPTPSAASLPEPRTTKRRSSSARSTCGCSKTRAATGRSSATVASTAYQPIVHRFLDASTTGNDK